MPTKKKSATKAAKAKAAKAKAAKAKAAKAKAAKAKAAKAKAAKKWQLYVLLCADGTLYCGITNDLERRISQHNAGKGARYTRGRGPVSLMRSWPQKNQSAALRAEISFKKLNRSGKQAYLEA